MAERKDLPETRAEQEPAEIHVNDYGSTKDAAVVVEEPNRTVLLTGDETLVFEKEPRIEIAPANRPRRVYGGMWGKSEIGAVGVSSMALLAVLLLYLFAVVPSNRQVEHNRVESDRLQEELTSAQGKYGDFTSAESQAVKLINSVNDFQLNYLPVAAVGKNALYQKINGLIGSYGLINSTGPDYTYLDAADQGNGKQTDEERGRSKFRSLFPGVYVTMTLEGSYQNLRRFVNDVERGGNDFVIISSIELEPSDSQAHPQTADGQSNSPNAARPTLNGQIYGGVINPGSGKLVTPNSPNYGMVNPTTGRPMNQNQYPGMPTNPIQQQFPQQQPTGPRGKAHGETVSLRIELAAYFRRPDFNPMVTAAEPEKGVSQ